jgi:hypothetical protein
MLQRHRIEERYIRPAIDAKVDRPVLDAYQAAGMAWELARRAGRPAAATAPLLAMIRAEIRRGEGDLALAHWRQLLALTPVPEVEPALLLRLAQRLQGAGDTPAAAAALRLALLERGGPLTRPLALRLSLLAREAAPDVAAAAARLAPARQ